MVMYWYEAGLEKILITSTIFLPIKIIFSNMNCFRIGTENSSIILKIWLARIAPRLKEVTDVQSRTDNNNKLYKNCNSS